MNEFFWLEFRENEWNGEIESMLQGLMNLIESLKESTFVWLILSLSTLLGIPAFFYSIVTRNKKELSYSKREEVLVSPVSGDSGKIKMYYDGQEVQNVSVSRYAIWYSGNDTIQPGDFVSDKPIKFSAKGDAVILDIAIDYKSDEDNNIKIVNPTSKDAEIQFKYLSRRDGAIIQVVHTGKADEIELSCKIMGGKKLREYAPIREHAPKSSKYSDFMEYLATNALLMLVAVTDISILSNFIAYAYEYSIYFAILSVVFMGGITIFSFMTSFSLMRSAKIGIPAKLRKHFLNLI